MCNTDIRKEIRDAGIKMWEVAERYGCTDGNFSRKLRRELPDKEKGKIRSIVEQLRKEAKICKTE